MQLPKNFDSRRVEEILRRENRFITELFSVLTIPPRDETDQDEELGETRLALKPPPSRAQSLSELQDRLKSITSKKKLTYKEKMSKKNLKNRLKKKTKQDERNAQMKLKRAEKFTHETSVTKPRKPIFNSDGKMVFSKFDFTNLGSQPIRKKEKDSKKILKQLEEDKEKIEEMVEKGQVEEAVEIKEKKAWKNAILKAEGVKVKDDPELLKKSVQKQEQKKRASKKKWEKRQEQVEKMKKDRQEKRTTNIEKRKKEKKVKKMKKAVKKGKIIPGF